MKHLVALMVLMSTPALAAPEPTAYRPFTYRTPCIIQANDEVDFDSCKVIETREKSGALRSRNIFSNRWGLTIKSRFDKKKGHVNWDSYNKHEYKWKYEDGGDGDLANWTYVMPGVLLKDVSWD